MLARPKLELQTKALDALQIYSGEISHRLAEHFARRNANDGQKHRKNFKK